MLLYLLFAVAAFADCETSTCLTCKSMTGCDWYGFDCLNKTGTLVTKLNPTVTDTCPTCQAGSCGECLAQTNCSWFSPKVPGVSGKCDATGNSNTGYDVVPVCPTCQNNNDCSSCYANQTQGCSWFTLPGGTAGKCREAAPSFAYSKVGSDKCGQALCSGIQSCTACQNATYGNNQSTCVWYNSANSKFYNSKCDDKDANFAQQTLYNSNAGATCPRCAGTSCTDCKAESGCKWVAVSTMGFGTGFGECQTDDATPPTGKSVIATCPATCKKYSCGSCTSNSECAWFAKSSIGADDECDLRDDKHYSQTPVTDSTACEACAANRCYECNNLPNCGWFVEKKLGLTIRQGCFAKNDPSIGDRTLRDNSNTDCDGGPNSSAHLAASFGLVFVLAMFA